MDVRRCSLATTLTRLMFQELAGQTVCLVAYFPSILYLACTAMMWQRMSIVCVLRVRVHTLNSTW
eukprot:2953035-Pleurochrysis_carterae.AAC.2